MKRIVCIDYGSARIGVAMTDPLQITVSPYATVPSDKQAIDALVVICKEKSASILVIGLPYGKDGEIGPAAQKVIAFTKKFKVALDKAGLEIEYFWQDERYTTRDAHETMREIKVKTKRKMQVVDQIAACNILRAFMDTRHKEAIDFSKI